MQPLVHEVPVVTALELRILADKLPILLEVAAGVAHRVVVFALDKWPVLLRVLAIALTAVYRLIHRAIDIRVVRSGV